MTTCNCGRLTDYHITGHAPWCKASPHQAAWLLVECMAFAEAIDNEMLSCSPDEKAIMRKHFDGADWVSLPDLYRRLSALGTELGVLSGYTDGTMAFWTHLWALRSHIRKWPYDARVLCDPDTPKPMPWDEFVAADREARRVGA